MNYPLKKIFDLLVSKLFKINDTPQKIAVGFALGTFSGIIPGMGPLASLFLAFVFRANRASALLASLITNTWLSFVTFIISVKLGSAVLGVKYENVRDAWLLFVKDFHFLDLFKVSVLNIALPIMLGYLVIGTFCGLTAYLFTLSILALTKRKYG